MNNVYITGDTHGCIDIGKLNSSNFPHGKTLDKSNIIIICGDFGCIWDGSAEDKYWIKWLTNKPWTTAFIDGNHENFDLLNAYPVEEWNGGLVHKISDSVIHLTRGQIFNLYDNTFFTMGGAESIDMGRRIEGKSWWKEEIPSVYDLMRGLSSLNRVNRKVDYVITHTGPSSYITMLNPMKTEDHNLTKFLDEVNDTVEFKHWYFGHFHKDRVLSDKHTAIYRDIKMIV